MPAIAVGRETFRPDAPQLVERLIQLQSKYALVTPHRDLIFL